MSNKIILVRTHKGLVDKGLVGYGWSSIDFSKYENFEELLTKGFKDINIGRKRKQISYFFNLEEGDIVIATVSGAIAIGKATNQKIYDEHTTFKHSTNQIKINFYQNKDGHIVYIPRKELETRLEKRLKIRTSIANLEDFKEEVKSIEFKIARNEIYTWDSATLEKEENIKNIFLKGLQKRLINERGLGIASGGYGLEKLIEEIFKAKGYDTRIPAKNEKYGIADVDIIVTKVSEFNIRNEGYLIQAKHHHGITGETGVKQLIAYPLDEEYIYHKKILMTTAKVERKLIEIAKKSSITIVEGEELTAWIYENLELLSPKTRRKLGISSIPTLL